MSEPHNLNMNSIMCSKNSIKLFLKLRARDPRITHLRQQRKKTKQPHGRLNHLR
ncbi:hypothetical protein X975_09819, partial [Stegodyphus mimosarum]